MNTSLFFLWSVGSVIVRFLPRVQSVSPSATCIIGFGDLCKDLATKSERRMVMKSCILQKVQLSLQLRLNFRDLRLSITIINNNNNFIPGTGRPPPSPAAPPDTSSFPGRRGPSCHCGRTSHRGRSGIARGGKVLEGNNIVADKR